MRARTQKKEPLKVQTRWMIRRDMPEVLDIAQGLGSFAWSEEDFSKALRQRNCIGLVAEENFAECARVVGYMVYELQKHKMEILSFAVRADCLRRQVGQQMLDKLKGKLVAHRRERIGVDVPERLLAAQLFFASQGFLAVGVRRAAFKRQDAFRMEFCIDGGRAPFVPLDRLQKYGEW